jgi:opacity protein-like surface antigen
MIRCLSFVLLCASALPLFGQSYIRAGFGLERSGDVTFRDVDCSSTEPPALFGCAQGIDGRSFGARGDLQSSSTFEVAYGRERGPLRAELVVTGRPGFSTDADANFTGVTGAQPVYADVRATTAMLAAAYDLGPREWRVRPFLRAGAGASHNAIGSITFAFPGIAPDAVTILRGGTETDFAWTAGAGLAFDLAGGLTVDITAHATNLGAIRTVHGNATIVRPTRRFELDIAPVETELKTRGVTVTVRQRF